MNFQKNEYSHKFQKPIIVIAGPSGAGKTTLVQGLNSLYPDYVMAISDTTKPQNLEKDTDGVDYTFISRESFIEKVKAGQYLEHNAFMGGNFYGTPKSEFDRIFQLDKIPALDIDINGLVQIDRLFPRERTLRLFLDVSEEEQERRLRHRARDTAESIKKRINFAREERVRYHDLEKKDSSLIDLYINNTEMSAGICVNFVINHLHVREQLMNGKL